MGPEQIKTKEIQKAIVGAIAFFDLFDCPLTLSEVWQYSALPGDLVVVKEILESGELSSIIAADKGFYFLSGRTSLARIRNRRYKYAQRKFKRALLIAKLFKIIPWIKLVAVSNVMGSDNMKDDGDIDLFIITEAKRAWLTRFCCVLILKILNWRPRPDNWRDKICLSFFVSEESMDMRSLLLAGTGIKSAPTMSNDIYFIYWLANLVPIYNIDNTYRRFLTANSWLKDYLPNWLGYITAEPRSAGFGWGNYYRDLIDLLVGGLEPILHKWQIKIMPAVLRNLLNQNTRVVVSDEVIKLHANDRREEYLEKFITQFQILETKFKL